MNNNYLENNYVYFQQLTQLLQQSNISINQISNQLKYKYLVNWINSFDCIKQKLQNHKLSEKIYWIIHNLTDFPKCKQCGLPLNHSFCSFTHGYNKYCSCACAQKSIETRQKYSHTCEKHFGKGIKNAQQAPEIKNKTIKTIIERYGVNNIAQSPLIQERIKNNYFQKTGYYHISQNPTVCKNKRKRLMYDNIYFDSSPELALYFYCKDNNIECEYHPNVCFTYITNDGIEHKYMPDFKINNKYYEIKGLQFFKNHDENDVMICPYKNKFKSESRYKLECEKYEAKHQCMLKNNVIILTDTKYSKYIKYIIEKLQLKHKRWYTIFKSTNV